MKGNQKCDTINGGSCIKCSFNEKIADLELKLLCCAKGYETSIRYVARIEAAEEIFNNIVELILDRDYEVQYISRGRWDSNTCYSLKTKNGFD